MARGGGRAICAAHRRDLSCACAQGCGAALCRQGQSANEHLQPASLWVLFYRLAPVTVEFNGSCPGVTQVMSPLASALAPRTPRAGPLAVLPAWLAFRPLFVGQWEWIETGANSWFSLWEAKSHHGGVSRSCRCQGPWDAAESHGVTFSHFTWDPEDLLRWPRLRREGLALQFSRSPAAHLAFP